jgi:ATP-dependent Clp protease ATP-binding subunit ClpA
MRRAIKNHLNTPLAASILNEDVDNTSKVVVSLRPDKLGLIFRQTGKKSKVSKEEGNNNTQEEERG